MTKETAGELFYVNVKDAVTVRKTMLETAKRTINCLQRLSKFQMVRDLKAQKLREINDLVHELEEMSIKFKGYMPDVKDKHLSSVGLHQKKGVPLENMKEELIKEVESKGKGKKGKNEKKSGKKDTEDEQVRKHHDDLTKLEDAINNIESKLNLMLK